MIRTHAEVGRRAVVTTHGLAAVVLGGLFAACVPATTVRADGPAVPVLSDAEAWKRLPPAEKGAGQPLPVWARALAATLPHTTAAMLELDYEHRARGPLPPQLRARLRWVVAHANRCALDEASAAADFLRAGGAKADLRATSGTREDLPAKERAALDLARKLTTAAHDVTDAEVARLVEWYGDRQVVALVLLVAYANFLDRLVLALDLPADVGALTPLEVHFAPLPLGASLAAPRRRAPEQPVKAADLLPAADADWLALDFDRLQKEVGQQRSRRPRLPLPAESPAAVQWGLLCRTYQPRLAELWAECKKAFGAEADQDPVFEASLFWVVTRTQQSFY